MKPIGLNQDYSSLFITHAVNGGFLLGAGFTVITNASPRLQAVSAAVTSLACGGTGLVMSGAINRLGEWMFGKKPQATVNHKMMVTSVAMIIAGLALGIVAARDR